MSFRVKTLTIGKLVKAPIWLLYRLRHFRKRISSIVQLDTGQIGLALEAKEKSIRQILESSPGASFLEIGIGGEPNLERLALMEKMKVSYSGCDFDSVCKGHERTIKSELNNPPQMRFLRNWVGTYSWTLFECLQRGETYDIIYLDGHHTFYVDLPVLFMVDYLLKPHGFLLIDDVKWTLELLRSNMVKYFSAWNFYHKMYNFEEYDSNQQKEEHIRLIVEELLLKRKGYKVDSTLSTQFWWVIRKT